MEGGFTHKVRNASFSSITDGKYLCRYSSGELNQGNTHSPWLGITKCRDPTSPYRSGTREKGGWKWREQQFVETHVHLLERR